MFFPVDKTETIDVTGYTCVLPTVSIGNVGQLSIDLIISTLKCELIGSIFHRAVVPLFGKNAFDKQSKRPTTAIDVYVSKNHKLLILQIRTALVKRHQGEFVDSLYSWLNDVKIANVLVLSSVDAVERHDRAISEPDQIYFYEGLSENKIDREEIQRLSGKEFKMHYSLREQTDVDDFFPGSGYLPALIDKTKQLNSTFVSLFLYCLEGDNRPQGTMMTSFVLDLLAIKKENGNKYRTKCPHSWAILDDKLDSALSMF